MKWREFFDVVSERPDYAIIRDSGAKNMIVDPAGLDIEIQAKGDGSSAKFDEFITEFDEWLRQWVKENAIEIYGVDLEEVAGIINRGGEGKSLIIDDNGEMSVGVLPPRYGGYCLGSPGSPWACFDLGNMHEKLVQMTADALSNYIQRHIFAFCGCTVVYCPCEE